MDILSYAMGKKAGGGGGGQSVPMINDGPASPSVRVLLSDAMEWETVGSDINEVDLYCKGFTPTDISEIQIVFLLYDSSAGLLDGSAIAIGSFSRTGGVLATYCSSPDIGCPGVTINTTSIDNDGGWGLNIQIDQTEAEDLGCEWHVLSIGL